MSRWLRWLAVLMPLAAGAAAAALITLWSAPRLPPNVHLIVDGATLALTIGAVISALAGAALLLVLWVRQQRAAAAQRAAQAAQDSRRLFLQRLDHELKNPLTAIQAGLGLLGHAPEAGSPPSEREATLERITTQVRRLSALTADLRKLAELETRPLERKPVDLPALLAEVVDINREPAEAGERRLTLTLPQAPWPLPNVGGDHDLLLLAIHNLVDNALKYSRPGDTVEVRALEAAGQVLVEVADTGPGVDADELPHLWEELYRARGARGLPGSGLGLALTQAILQRHGGQAEVRSRPGQGTVFAVRLPTS